MTTNKNQLQQQQTTSSSQGSMISNQSSVKTLKDSSYSTASSIASTTKTASSAENQNFGKNSEKPNITDADALATTTNTTPSWVRGAGTSTPTNFGGSPAFGSPSIRRRQINQSPAPVDQEP